MRNLREVNGDAGFRPTAGGGRPAAWLAACAALGLAIAAAPAVAADRLEARTIEDTFKGMTLDGVYSHGGFFSETYNEDGSVRYHDRDGADSGEWSLKGDMFCTFYEHQQGSCFNVLRDGDNCFSFYEMVEKDGKQVEAGAWTSRGWSRDKPSTCPTAPEVAI